MSPHRDLSTRVGRCERIGQRGARTPSDPPHFQGERARVSFPFDLKIVTPVTDSSGGQLEAHAVVQETSATVEDEGGGLQVALRARWAGEQ